MPLYDGVGFPDEPYRYVDQSNGPANASVLGPTSTSGTFTATDLGRGVSISTGETGPQFSLVLSPGAISLPNATDKITLKATPLAPSDQPNPGTIAGDIYEVSATTQSGQPKFDSTEGQLFLRLPQGTPTSGTVAIVYRAPGGKWQSEFTSQTGNDIYELAFNGPGDYAMATGVPLASPPPSQNATSSTSNKKSSSISKFVLVGIFLFILALIILAIRRLSPRPGNKPKSSDNPHTTKH